MSGKTAEEYALYNSCLGRSGSTVSVSGTGESINNESKTEKLSREISEKQIALLKTFPNLSLISNTLEDTIIVLDDDGEETQESENRRRKVLFKLETALKNDTRLLNKTRETCPDFCTDMEEVLGSEYYLIYAKAVTKLRQLCVLVSTTPVFDDSDFDYDDLTDEDIEDDIYFDHPDDFLDSREDGEIEEPYYSKDDMLIMISEELDTDDFQRACIIARTYLKDQLDKYSKAVTAEKVDEDVRRLTKSNNRSLEIINKYTAYLNMPKTFNKPEDKANKPKEDDDLTY